MQEWMVPGLVSLFGIIISTLVAMIRSDIKTLHLHSKEIGDRLFTHLLTPTIHESGFAKTEEQIKNLLQTVKVAHERIDRIEEVRR